MPTKIEWCDETINPLVGCSPVSSGCANCYAARMGTRHAANPKLKLRYEGIAEGGKWTGRVRFVPSELDKPPRWKKARRVFVGSMGDLFHSKISVSDVRAVFEMVRACPQHTFFLLTKRPGNMAALTGYRPLPRNTWLGVSVEDQETANERLPLLFSASKARYFVSVEPMLGPMDLAQWLPHLGWVICGAENGHGARSFDCAWARVLRDQCAAAGTPFFFKGAGPGRETPPDLMIEEFSE